MTVPNTPGGTKLIEMADQPTSDLQPRPDELPVVARLVVEIRSDGTRTIARGALEDRVSGETVAIETHGTTPAALAASLVRALQRLPMLAVAQTARHAVKRTLAGLLGGRKP